MAPFYALGYGVERLLAPFDGRAADSFGPVPQLFYGLGALCYGLLGGWATFFACRRVAGAAAAALASLGMMLGGPLLFYLFFHPAMSHAPSFALVAVLVLRWWRHWDLEAAGTVLRPAVSRWARPATQAAARAGAELGLWLGLLVLVRYQNLTYALLPLAYALRLARTRSPAAAWRAGGAAALTALAVLSLQGIHLLRYGSSGGLPLGLAAQGGRGLTLAENRLDLASPNFWRVLFSCQHGAFYWTPMLALGGAGLLWAAWRHSWARVFLAVFLANVYLVGCLSGGTNWSGDHAFGMRYLADCAPLLAAGLAAALAAGLTRLSARGGHRVAAAGVRAAAALVALLVAANGLLVLAFSTGAIAHEGCVTYPQMAAAIGRTLAGRPAPLPPPRISALCRSCG